MPLYKSAGTPEKVSNPDFVKGFICLKETEQNFNLEQDILERYKIFLNCRRQNHLRLEMIISTVFHKLARSILQRFCLLLVCAGSLVIVQAQEIDFATSVQLLLESDSKTLVPNVSYRPSSIPVGISFGARLHFIEGSNTNTVYTPALFVEFGNDVRITGATGPVIYTKEVLPNIRAWQYSLQVETSVYQKLSAYFDMTAYTFSYEFTRLAPSGGLDVFRRNGEDLYLGAGLRYALFSQYQ